MLVCLSFRDEVVNDGTTLYVTGLSTRVTERELEDHFSKEGKVCAFLIFGCLLSMVFLEY